jgi:hypothetical protein
MLPFLTPSGRLGGLGVLRRALFAGVSNAPDYVYTTDFTTVSSLPAEWSASGGANGTRVNSTGLIVAGAAPRFDYNPNTLASKGLLIEEARTNRVLSSACSSAAWTDEGTTRSSGVTGPDGAAAIKLTETATNATHSIFQDVGGANVVPFGSVYLKMDGRRYASVCLGQTNWAIFDLQAGAVTQTAAGTTATITTAGNGWFKCTITHASLVTDYYVIGTSDVGTIGSPDTFGRGAYTGDGTSGIYVYGAQFEQGASFGTSLIPTTTATVTRSADAITTNSPLTGYLAAGPSIIETTDIATGATARTAFAAGAFAMPNNSWLRSMAVYAAGTDTSGHMTVGSPY